MKQHITTKQLDELSEKNRAKIFKWRFEHFPDEFQK